MRSKTKCIVHFLPLERYPPAINFLKILVAAHPDLDIHVVTAAPGKGRKTMAIPGVRIHRFGEWNEKRSLIARVIFYLHFIRRTFFLLKRLKPSAILYYESISAAAPCIYKKWFDKSVRLFIHYHEYASPEELNSKMILNKWLYKLERSIFKYAEWVSHTNEDRMNLFLKQLGNQAPTRTYILPNHPLASWSGNSRGPNASRKPPIGIVYLGALSVDNFFLKEMATWVAANASTCYWDIYSDNYDPAAIEFLKEMHAPNITFKGGVAYDELPALLPSYAVGVILYTGHIPNYVYNIPNKLFEYHVTGLDTWFPEHMISCHRVLKQNSYPKIIAVDFKRLENFTLEKLVCNEGLPYVKNEFVAEKTYQPLVEAFAN